MLLRTPMILQFDIPPVHRLPLLRHPPLVAGDTCIHKQHKMHDQNQCQEHISGNLHATQLINHRIAILTPVIEPIARNAVANSHDHRLPPPEPAYADAEDYGGDGEGPGKEIGCDGETGVDWFAISTVEGKIEEGRIVKEGYEELKGNIRIDGLWEFRE